MSRIFKSAEQLIGNTPLLELTNFEKKMNLKAKVYAKLEFMNRAGAAVKAQTAYARIQPM